MASNTISSCSSCNSPQGIECGCDCEDIDAACREEYCSTACPQDKLNPYAPNCTLCNLNTECNIFYEIKADGNGRCILDEMTFEQLICILQRNPKAKKHLLQITNDSCLLAMANRTGLIVPVSEQNIILQRRINNNIPYYTLFRGNTGGDII